MSKLGPVCIAVGLAMITASSLIRTPQVVTERHTSSPYWHGRPMLARWVDHCQIVVVEDVESPDVVNVSWPADESDGRGWYYGPIPPSRLEPLKR